MKGSREMEWWVETLACKRNSLKKQTCGDERMEREIFMIQKREGTILAEKSLSG